MRSRPTVRPGCWEPGALIRFCEPSALRVVQERPLSAPHDGSAERPRCSGRRGQAAPLLAAVVRGLRAKTRTNRVAAVQRFAESGYQGSRLCRHGLVEAWRVAPPAKVTGPGARPTGSTLHVPGQALRSSPDARSGQARSSSSAQKQPGWGEATVCPSLELESLTEQCRAMTQTKLLAASHRPSTMSEGSPAAGRVTKPNDAGGLIRLAEAAGVGVYSQHGAQKNRSARQPGGGPENLSSRRRLLLPAGHLLAQMELWPSEVHPRGARPGRGASHADGVTAEGTAR